MAESAILIGGQAVIEGVMMRSPRWTSTAVRLPHGEITAFTEPVHSLLLRHRVLRAPVLRGVIVLYEALRLGVRALFWSANAALGTEEAMTPRQALLAIVTGLGLAIGLFFLLPAAIGRALDPYLGSVYTLNLAEGAVRVAVLVTYIAAIGRLPDIRRIFAYHGAEHKAVNAYEAGAALDVASVRACSRFHPRCGTSFLLIVMIVAVIVFSFLGRPPLLLRLLSRVAFIPLVAGVSYEIIRAGARSRWVRPLVLPGLWLQRLTTREPDDDEIEVAVRALREVVDREQATRAAPPVL
ncbi:MAG: DUF1385 domain-containing protein [Armatimonadota bacterium]|nr:DUF1385 domain-containing protein [Armatimonadota bacterium]MDR7451127.1 DUF1385 domain-containing protein [Armatimonadota bacterium]MDR7467268.1 DUF1385 domain-containing protein [Armatimonadota bacterium]MDR7494529.1 DUF1385 domain-containing protein [Armatimonadota bacterium]MDR7499894.1 DUF1385 domain-containing protein [Armatimonadota bacterium]